MPAYEIHVETYTVEDFDVVTAKDAYEAAISWAARYAPCSLRRVYPEMLEADRFVITATGSTDDGLEIEVFEHDPSLR